MYDGFVERAQSVERLLHDRRTTFAVVTTLEAAPLYEAENFSRSSAIAGSIWARWCSTRPCPTACSIPTVPRRPRSSSTRRPRWPTCSRRIQARRSRTRSDRRGAADDQRVVRQLLCRRNARGGAACRVGGNARRRDPGARVRARHQRRRVVACRHSGALFVDS